MCQDIQKVTFHCGHQVSFWWGNSRFCLFTGEAKDRFHTTYVFFERNGEKCPRCEVIEKIKQQGKVMKGAVLRQIIEKHYADTQDSREELSAKYWEGLAEKARSTLTAEQVVDLNSQVMERIVFYLGKDNVTPGSKTVLLRTITMLPDIFHHQKLVQFFASRYFGDNNRPKQFEEWERKKVFSIVRHVRLDRTFKAGLTLGQPIPLPVRRRNAEGGVDKSASEVQ
ncbi:hypothetical protein GGS24DRAFT_499889 [Hypoxylon argillaceum]|nr:hypothetical protein GGS24DRAFT_499889 [Hypoxylon argillaceum]